MKMIFVLSTVIVFILNLNIATAGILDDLLEEVEKSVEELSDTGDVKKNKLDIDFKPYRILGACNPKIAHEALQVNLEIGLLLPCNVVLWENSDNSTTVSAINAEKMLSLVNEDKLIDEAKNINSLLKKAIDSL